MPWHLMPARPGGADRQTGRVGRLPGLGSCCEPLRWAGCQYRERQEVRGRRLGKEAQGWEMTLLRASSRLAVNFLVIAKSKLEIRTGERYNLSNSYHVRH